jgi:hypothetical protein
VSSGSRVDITTLLAPTNDLGKLTPVGETTIQNQATKTKQFELSSFSLGAKDTFAAPAPVVALQIDRCRLIIRDVKKRRK